ncbi:MAG: TolC family protein [Nitrospiraceae bacterium]|nr:TolC family protein [Nitrospiraceae bacterium]
MNGTARLLVVLGLLGVTAVSGAQEAGVEQMLEVSAQEMTGDPLTDDQVQMLNGEINVGRIDLERLRQIVAEASRGEKMRMSLMDCIQLALAGNPDLQVAAIEPEKSVADILSAKGEFDPTLSGSFNYVRASQEASAEYRTFGGINSIDTYNTRWQIGVGGKLHWGTAYEVSLDIDKTESTYNSFIEEYSGGLTLTLSQPLLRGRSAKANLANIRIAKLSRQVSDLTVLQTVMTTISEVIKAYWDLVGARENLRVREESLANAERLLEITQKQLAIGTVAAIEVLQSKAGVAVRQSDLISARSSVSDAEDLLKQLLNLRDGDIFSARQILPTDRPKVAEFDLEAIRLSDEELKDRIDMALETRPEMLIAKLEIDTSQIERDRAANDLLPKLDVTGSLYQGGREHYLSGVFDGIRERTDNSYSYGVQGSVPIGNRAARGQYQRAKLNVRQSERKLERTKQEIMLKVRLALRGVYTSQILVESNGQARALQEANVTAEEKRLRLGVTTSYRVLQVQEDLTSAQTQEVSARVAYEKALVELRLAEGALLDSLGIEYVAPEPEPTVRFFRSVYPRSPK